MLTTAGSTRFTIPEKLFEDGIGSGRESGAAEVPANENDRMAETFPETTVPIRMPTERVAAISPAATYVRRLVQFTLEFVDCSITIWLLSISVAQSTCGKYNTVESAEFLLTLDSRQR